MKTTESALASVLVALLAVASAADGAYASGLSSPDQNGGAAARPVTPALGTGWRRFRNAHAGFVARYPRSWTIKQGPGQDGSSTVTFTQPDGRAAITVTVKRGSGPVSGNQDLPNQRCIGTTVGGRVPALECLDPLSFSVTTTVTGHGKSYVIVSSFKRLNIATYRRFTRSFKPISG
ncbi:MAG: hypothetical protein ACR2JC_16150 [Chloroflexota bacterium]|nr:MAG: hypothetical protein DLM70_12850 [Chloroflexota bacterium]